MLARSRCQMTKQRRSFSAEFNREAAGLVLKQIYSYIETSRSLGVGTALRRIPLEVAMVKGNYQLLRQFPTSGQMPLPDAYRAPDQ